MSRYAITVTLTFNAATPEQAAHACYTTLADAFEDYSEPTGDPDDVPELTNWTYNPEPLELIAAPLLPLADVRAHLETIARRQERMF